MYKIYPSKYLVLFLHTFIFVINISYLVMAQEASNMLESTESYIPTNARLYIIIY